jgi:uracil-DNA glycosylase
MYFCKKDTMFNLPQNDWLPIFEMEKSSILLQKIYKHYQFEQSLNREIFPKESNIFNAFNLCSFENTKVVILGQDPYHGKGEAHGLAFSVEEGIKMPPSLRNIFKELKNEYPNFNTTRSTDLSDWAQQGVLLINAVLTVEKDKPASHKHYEWELFTNHIISTLSKNKKNLVFLLLGKFAQNKEYLIDSQFHTILKTTHPSPLSASRGFLGSNIFKKCNEILVENSILTIDWDKKK